MSRQASAVDQSVGPNDWLGAATTAGALVLSIVVTFVLGSSIASLKEDVFQKKLLATLVPPAGSLSGRAALDGADWHAGVDDKRFLVLFGVAEDGEPGDVEYWYEVVKQTTGIAPEIQFAGLCVTNERCGVTRTADGRIAFLQSMDLLQTHALSVALREHRAFLFRGQKPDGAVLIHKDASAFAASLTTVVNRKLREGGL